MMEMGILMVKFPSQIEVDAGVSMNASELKARVRNIWFYPTANINPVTNVSSLQFNVRVEDNLGLFKRGDNIFKYTNQ